MSAALVPASSLSPVSVSGSTIERFREVAAALADAPALVSPGQSLTFGEAERASNAIAAAIAAASGSDDAPIATLLDHSAHGLVGLLAALKTGRPVVPLDPLIPAARLEQIIRASGATTCLSDPRHAPIVEALRSCIATWIDLDAARTAPATLRIARAERTCHASDPTVVVFTSGSTGVPKGVVWTHGTILNEALAGAQGLHFAPGDRVGLVLPYSFAAGLTVVFFALLNGCGLYAYDPRALGITGLPDFSIAQRLTTLHTTPSLMRALVGALQKDQQLCDLRLLTSCGEAVYASDIAAVRPFLPDSCKYVNWSGASEMGTLAFYPVPAATQLPDGPVPAGFPAANKHVAIIREDGQPAAVGETGELIVSSDWFSAGYWRAAEQTATRFSPLPDGRTRYRSGDLARIASDGALTLLGRRDAALKIRGYLVEPSEVEAALSSCAAVSDAVVVAVHKPPAPSRLIAYVVPNTADGQKTISSAALRGMLRQKLPTWMVPATIVWLHELPRNERGKVDRLALPPAPLRAAEFVPPLLEWELVLADLWMQVLHLDSVSANDDFSELGGDSLAAEQLLRTISDTLGIVLPSNTLIEAPTLAEFAARVGNAERRTPGHPTIVSLRTSGLKPPLFCFAGAGGLGFSFLSLSRQLGDDQPIYAFQAHGLERRGIPDWSIERSAARHIQMIRVLAPRGPYLLAGHSLGGLIAMEVAHQLKASGEQVGLLALLDTYVPARSPSAPDPNGVKHRGSDAAALRPDLSEELQRGAPLEASERRSALRVSQDILSELRYTLQHRLRPSSLMRMARVPFAGLIQYPGLVQFDTFFNQGRILERFYYPRPWEGRTIVYRAQDNPDPLDAWAGLLPGSHDVFHLACEHFSVLREPHVGAIAKQLALEIGGLLAARDPLRSTG